VSRVLPTACVCVCVRVRACVESPAGGDGRGLRPDRDVGPDRSRRARLQLVRDRAASLERHARQPATPHRAVARSPGAPRERLAMLTISPSTRPAAN